VSSGRSRQRPFHLFLNPTSQGPGIAVIKDLDSGLVEQIRGIFDGSQGVQLPLPEVPAGYLGIPRHVAGHQHSRQSRKELGTLFVCRSRHITSVRHVPVLLPRCAVDCASWTRCGVVFSG
jgi:hypothetical protein